MERAGNADARVPRNYAQLYDSASDENVDVAGASAKRTRIDGSVLEYFHVYAEGQPVDPTETQVDIITSAEQKNAPIVSDLATPQCLLHLRLQTLYSSFQLQISHRMF
jgi:hypothetical protein